MQPQDALQQLTAAMMLVMYLSMPPILVATVAGVLVSLLQALTQIQEQTLSFAIKLVAVVISIAALAGIMGAEVLNFTIKLFDDFPSMT